MSEKRPSAPGAAAGGRPNVVAAKRRLILDRLQRGLQEAAALDRIPRRPASGPAPLSFAQERLWFLDQYLPRGPAYNLAWVARLEGVLDAPALARALDEVVRRHETLRTTFAAPGGVPAQVIAPPSAVALAPAGVAGATAADRLDEARRQASLEAARPFDLSRGPVFRARLWRLGDDDHVLALVMHHIVADGWSVAVLLRELGALYEAYSAGRPSPLVEPAIQYADYAAWQRRPAAGEPFAAGLEFWKRHLGGDPPPLELPADRPRPAVQRFCGAVHAVPLPPRLVAALAGLGRRQGATAFMTLLAAFQALLWRWTGQDDIIIGTPVANRERPEVEGLIGFFVNTLALRASLGDDPAFRELLERVRLVALEAFDHQDVPFERLVEALQPERSLSHTPLFQVMFVLQNAPAPPRRLGEAGISPLEVEWSTTKFDLTLAVGGGERGMTAAFEYSTDLFDAATIERLARHYQTLLASAAADPDRRLSELELMGAAERHQVLYQWNDTQSDYPAASCVHDLFSARAGAAPGAAALVCAGRTMSYRELDRRSNQLARYLRRLGVVPETLVGLCGERSPEMVVAMLAILKAGGAYVPLDPSYPRERLAFMMRDARMPMLLVPSRLEGGPLEGGPLDGVARVVRLDADRTAVAAEDDAPLASGAAPDNLAYVMYTSGSTGTPKGVAVTHRNVVRLVTAQNYAEFGPGEVFLQGAPISFDAATLEVWGALLNGGRLVVMPPTTPSLAELGRAVRDNGVTTLWLTAGLFRQMVDEHLSDLAGVRQLLAGGDVLPVPQVVKALGARGGGTLVNGYGPTETTTFACCHVMTAASGADATAGVGAAVPIGRPIANARAYILDHRLRPAPVGIAGELYIGGDGVARGYHARPALTAGRFVPDPYGSAPGGRLYRTGDLCRWRMDGAIEFLGRHDRQVKIRGFRIELGEVEAALAGCPAVLEAAVVAREDAPGDRRLVAYVVPRSGGAPPAAAELREFMRQRLPEYMLPSSFVPLQAMPLTPTGKVDRRALPAPERAGDAPTAAFEAPGDDIEEELARIWAALLKVDRVGRRDDFFELGGHSLLAIQMLSRVRDTFGVELPVRALFEKPTLAGLAGLIAAALAGR